MKRMLFMSHNTGVVHVTIQLVVMYRCCASLSIPARLLTENVSELSWQRRGDASPNHLAALQRRSAYYDNQPNIHANQSSD